MRLALFAFLVGCGSARPAPPAPAPAPASVVDAPSPVVEVDIDSRDILARPDEVPKAHVKHVLIAWKDLAETYGDQLDPRAATRTREQAAQLASGIAQRLRGDVTKIDALIDEHGEDPGARTHEPYVVTAGGLIIAEFKSLALRRKVDEVGFGKTDFGYQVVLPGAEPPPDPLQSNDILARAPEPGPMYVVYLIVPWAQGTKQEADALVQKVITDVSHGDPIAKVAERYSVAKFSDTSTELTSAVVAPQEVTKLVERLRVGEAGLVASGNYWFVMKRVAPPPPDPLDSVKILARQPVTEHAKVKHILLGWTDVHADDERGKKRTRAQLERLVKATVKKLEKGAKIEPLMRELSEDPGSDQSGMSYDVSPDAGLVPPFKNLSLRLEVGEVGVVKTEFGIHIIQRVE